MHEVSAASLTAVPCHTSRNSSSLETIPASAISEPAHRTDSDFGVIRDLRLPPEPLGAVKSIGAKTGHPTPARRMAGLSAFAMVLGRSHENPRTFQRLLRPPASRRVPDYSGCVNRNAPPKTRKEGPMLTRRIVGTMAVVMLLGAVNANADVISDWNSITMALVEQPEPVCASTFCGDHAAGRFRSGQRHQGRLQADLGTVKASGRASAEAAAVAAAYRVLATVFSPPTWQPWTQPGRPPLGSIADGAAKDEGSPSVKPPPTR